MIAQTFVHQVSGFWEWPSLDQSSLRFGRYSPKEPFGIPVYFRERGSRRLVFPSLVNISAGCEYSHFSRSGRKSEK